MDASQFLLPRDVGVQDDVIAVAIGRPEAINALGGEQALVDDALQEFLGVGIQLARRLAIFGMIEDLREFSLELPGHEEEGPIDIRSDRVQRHIIDQSTARKRWHGDIGWLPLDLQWAGTSRLVRDKGSLAPSPEDRAQALMLIAVGPID